MHTLLSAQPRIITENNITVVVDNKPVTVNSSHMNYNKIRNLFKSPDSTVEDFLELQDIPQTIHTSTAGKISIGEDMTVRYGDTVMHNALTRRMISMLQEGYDISSLVAFMENLMMNPSKTAVDELYEFLEKNNLPITPEGHFLAYKRVTDDFKDCHTKTFDNSVGKVLEVPRNQVDDNRDHECSYGLHFCSLEYLPHFGSGSGMIVIVKINPKDVVAFPRDYNFSKGRTARYEVVGIHSKGETVGAFDSVFNDEFSDSDECNCDCGCDCESNSTSEYASVAEQIIDLQDFDAYDEIVSLLLLDDSAGSNEITQGDFERALDQTDVATYREVIDILAAVDDGSHCCGCGCTD